MNWLKDWMDEPLDDFRDFLSLLFAIAILILCLIGYSLVNNESEPVKPRQQIVTIKNNGQEIVYYVDGNRVKLGYEDKE